jgi:hypothetical protein
MTREEAKRRAELYSALADGKTIQAQNPNKGEWFDVKIETLRSISEELSYRIKPEPKYRPFRTQEECWQEMHKHPDFGWVTDGYYKSTICVKSNSIAITISSYEYSFVKAFETHKFTDGTPFGIKEE